MGLGNSSLSPGRRGPCTDGVCAYINHAIYGDIVKLIRAARGFTRASGYGTRGCACPYGPEIELTVPPEP